MKRIAVFLLLLAATTVLAQDRPASRPAGEENGRFAYVDVSLEATGARLAAYQFELKVTQGDAILVGLQGGERDPWRMAPYYDPTALDQGRIILAAFTTAKELPGGKVCVARVSVMVRGAAEPEYAATLEVATDANGDDVAAAITLVKGQAK